MSLTYRGRLYGTARRGVDQDLARMQSGVQLDEHLVHGVRRVETDDHAVAAGQWIVVPASTYRDQRVRLLARPIEHIHCVTRSKESLGQGRAHQSESDHSHVF
jgi:hypothetical protein